MASPEAIAPRPTVVAMQPSQFLTDEGLVHTALGECWPQNGRHP